MPPSHQQCSSDPSGAGRHSTPSQQVLGPPRSLHPDGYAQNTSKRKEFLEESWSDAQTTSFDSFFRKNKKNSFQKTLLTLHSLLFPTLHIFLFLIEREGTVDQEKPLASKSLPDGAGSNRTGIMSGEGTPRGKEVARLFLCSASEGFVCFPAGQIHWGGGLFEVPAGWRRSCKLAALQQCCYVEAGSQPNEKLKRVGGLWAVACTKRRHGPTMAWWPYAAVKLFNPPNKKNSFN